MSVKIRLVGDLRRFTDSDTVEMAGDRYSLATAVDELVRRYPRIGKELFDDRGRFHYAVVLKVGDRRVTWPADKEERIDEGSELLLTRFHSGG